MPVLERLVSVSAQFWAGTIETLAFDYTEYERYIAKKRKAEA